MLAKIECPHCGGAITVRARQAEVDAMATEADRTSAETAGVFRSVDASFRRIFDQPFWRRGRT
jgi:hypothetical protein